MMKFEWIVLELEPEEVKRRLRKWTSKILRKNVILSPMCTTRGKRGTKQFCEVLGVQHESREIVASSKATLNAPFWTYCSMLILILTGLYTVMNILIMRRISL